MRCYSNTASNSPAAIDLSDRIADVARCHGVTVPVGFDEILCRTFVRPREDAAYQENCLQPGALPLEWSFSERDSEALRIELQPFDPALAPNERLQRATEVLSAMVAHHYDVSLARKFEAAANIVAFKQHSDLAYGAFLGLVLHPRRAPRFKLYLEFDSTNEVQWQGLLPTMPDVAPHFRSVMVGAGMLAERYYFLCQNGLRLIDL